MNAATEPIVPANTIDLDVTYIFTIPSEQTLQRNCSGGVVSIQYCYEANNVNIGETDIFNLLSLDSIQTGNDFRVDSSIPIRSTPSNEICVPQVSGTVWCCDNTPLSNNEFSIPSYEYTFGVVTFNGVVTPLAFNDTVGTYEVDRIAFNAGIPSVGSTVAAGVLEQDSLLLLRFFIGIVKWRPHVFNYVHYACPYIPVLLLYMYMYNKTGIPKSSHN